MLHIIRALLLCFTVPALAAPAQPETNSTKWPDLPFNVSGRDILSASGAKVVYAGVNWPGAADTMLPEGLQYNSIANISKMIKSLGMNVVRLTYAIEMIDDHYAKSPNQTLNATLVNALGQRNGTIVLAQILKNNPNFTAATTRLQVFDAVAAGLAKQQIWVHLDNHVSKAEWCCGLSDGNAWFGDTYFNVTQWQRGLGFMASHAKNWTNLASMSLRNELRPSINIGTQPVNWNSWIDNVLPAAAAIHNNNSHPLIFFSGQSFDTDDTYFVQRQTWNNATFTPEAYAYKHKVVYEIHNYDNTAKSCDQSLKPALYNSSYCAMNLTDTACPNHAPVVMTEFGFDNSDDSYQDVYATCIRETVTGQPGGPGGWMQWVVAGSYYIRQGTQDSEETWGLLNHNWTAWRQQAVIDKFVKPFVAAS